MKWHVLFAGRWSQHEHNNVLELRTVVSVLRHLSRTSQSWGHRVMIFTDSMVSLGALQKGRSSAKDILHLCRVGAIIQMVSQIRGYFRWVPSEHNLADGPSRGLGIGAAEETIRQHVRRAVPKRLERLLRERRYRGGAGLWHGLIGTLRCRSGWCYDVSEDGYRDVFGGQTGGTPAAHQERRSGLGAGTWRRAEVQQSIGGPCGRRQH